MGWFVVLFLCASGPLASDLDCYLVRTSDPAAPIASRVTCELEAGRAAVEYMNENRMISPVWHACRTAAEMAELMDAQMHGAKVIRFKFTEPPPAPEGRPKRRDRA